MKIRMLVSIAGTDYSISRDEITERFGVAEATRLIAAGYAEEVKEEAVREVPSGTLKVERAVKKQAGREKRDVVSG